MLENIIRLLRWIRGSSEPPIVWYVKSRLLYWFGSLFLAFFPIGVKSTKAFAKMPGFSEIYKNAYSDRLIVVMTFLGLSIFDCFEMFRFLDREVKPIYVGTVALALIVFLMFCGMLAQFSVASSNILAIEDAGFLIDRLPAGACFAALAICLLTKLFVSILEYNNPSH